VDDESDSTNDEDSLFDESADETDITTDDDIDSLLGDSDDDTDDESLFDDEEQHPPEYYLDEAEKLDPNQLRQERYCKKTQARLDWVKEHCIL